MASRWIEIGAGKAQARAYVAVPASGSGPGSGAFPRGQGPRRARHPACRPLCRGGLCRARARRSERGHAATRRSGRCASFHEVDGGDRRARLRRRRHAGARGGGGRTGRLRGRLLWRGARGGARSAGGGRPADPFPFRRRRRVGRRHHRATEGGVPVGRGRDLRLSRRRRGFCRARQRHLRQVVGGARLFADARASPPRARAALRSRHASGTATPSSNSPPATPTRP